MTGQKANTATKSRMATARRPSDGWISRKTTTRADDVEILEDDEAKISPRREIGRSVALDMAAQRRIGSRSSIIQSTMTAVS